MDVRHSRRSERPSRHPRRATEGKSQLRAATDGTAVSLRLTTSYAFLDLMANSMAFGAPPFNDATDPLFKRTIELARDLVGAALPATPERSRKNRANRRSTKSSKR